MYLLDELLNDEITIELFGEIDDDGRQEKIILNNVKCNVQYKSHIKYTSDDKIINLNGFIYVNGRINDGIITDGKITYNNKEFKIMGFTEYKDPFSNNVIYTKLEIV